MRSRLFSSDRPAFPSVLLALAALTLGPAAQAAPGTLRDFRLPPDPEATPQQPVPHGPVAPDVPASTNVLRGAATPSLTPTPAPTASPVVQPAPVPTATPPAVLPRVTPPAPAAARNSAASSQADAPAPAPTATPSPEPQAVESSAPALSPSPAASPLPLPASPPVPQAGADEGGLPWLWIAAALLALAALGAAAWLLRRRAGTPRSTAVPQIERPNIAPPKPAAPVPAPSPAAEPTTRSSLDVELEPVRLSLTLLNASLSYRLLLNNRGAEPLENLSITADMISAHAKLSREQQLSGPDAGALQVACIELLEPGESRIVSGEFRLPFGQIMPIRQGNAALLFPLARFRIEGTGREPVTRTFLVAQPPEQAGAGLQPFRLDLGPRIYPKLAQRAFA